MKPRTSSHNHIAVGALLLLSVITVSCTSYLSDSYQRNDEFEIHNAGKYINTDHDEYAPQISQDGNTLIFTTNRPVASKDGDYDKIFRSDRNTNEWMMAERVKTNAGDDVNEGSVVFDYAHKQVFFVQCYRPDGIGDCDMYVADLKGTIWDNVRNAGRQLNSPDWDSHPTLTGDGNAMYFASERLGGAGGSDIWMSERKGDSTWSTPVNLGLPVNTRGDEKTPFITKDGKSLYFSSDTHLGYGGYDIFRSDLKGKAWSKPVNLGKPINSKYDDLFYVTSFNGDTAYIASNRIGGAGALDIYEIFRKPPPPIPPKPKQLIVQYKIKNAFTRAALPAHVTISTGDKDSDWNAGPNGVIEQIILSGEEYSLTATMSGFMSKVDSFYYPPGEFGLKERELLLTPITENERKIYSFTVEFDFNFSDIRPNERKHLDSVVTLLEQFPNSTVVASGHTDSVGTETYNIKLGYSRAKEVSTYVGMYLKQKGVKFRHPLDIRTYGEAEPRATNSTEEGRQRNRRVEIAVVRNE